MTEKITQFVIEFDYNLEALNFIKKNALSINKDNIEEVENTIKELVKVRRAIETKGKAYRDETNAFNKTVLTKEKEYIGVIEPVELELKEILEKEKGKKVMEARKELLPMKKQQLSVLKVSQPSDEEIIGMNDEQWIAFYNEKFAEHTRQVENEIKAEQQEKERIEREANIKKEAEERAKTYQVEALKEAEETKLKAEMEAKVKMEADKKYQKWLSENGWTEETKSDFVIENVGNKVRLSKIISFFTI